MSGACPSGRWLLVSRLVAALVTKGAKWAWCEESREETNGGERNWISFFRFQCYYAMLRVGWSGVHNSG